MGTLRNELQRVVAVVRKRRDEDGFVSGALHGAPYGRVIGMRNDQQRCGPLIFTRPDSAFCCGKQVARCRQAQTRAARAEAERGLQRDDGSRGTQAAPECRALILQVL